MSSELHVLVVDDSAVVRQALTEILGAREGMRVSVAADAIVALSKMSRAPPDVIVLDLELPRMSGLEFMARLAASPRRIPIVVCSAHTQSGSDAALRALAGGAVEIVTKPKLGVRDFLTDSAVFIADAVRAAASSRPPLAAGPARSPRSPAAAAALARRPGVVALGASTGGTEALLSVIGAMPSSAPGMVVVQHMPEGFTAALARRLDSLCAMRVKEAVSGDLVEPGLALIAPGNRHLSLVRARNGYAVSVGDGPLVSRHRPSVDVLFMSVAEVAGPDSMGVVLTGMGSDGARGLAAMRAAGARTLAQDEASCVVFGMPKEAILLGGAERVVPLDEMAASILTSG